MFWPFTVWTNCSSYLRIFANSRPSSALNFKCFLRSLRQFLLLVGQNNFRNQNTIASRAWIGNLKQRVPITSKSSKLKGVKPYVIKLPKSTGSIHYCPQIRRVPGTPSTRANSSSGSKEFEVLQVPKIFVALSLHAFKYEIDIWPWP